MGHIVIIYVSVTHGSQYSSKNSNCNNNNKNTNRTSANQTTRASEGNNYRESKYGKLPRCVQLVSGNRRIFMNEGSTHSYSHSHCNRHSPLATRHSHSHSLICITYAANLKYIRLPRASECVCVCI